MVPPAAVSGSDPISLFGVFGYASIDVHMKWRETPEGIRAAATVEKDEDTNLDFLVATIVPGVDPSTGYFHVIFHEGM